MSSKFEALYNTKKVQTTVLHDQNTVQSLRVEQIRTSPANKRKHMISIVGSTEMQNSVPIKMVPGKFY